MAEDGREYLLGGDELRAQRVARGWSSRHVARLLGVAHTTVQNLETGASGSGDELRRAYMELLEESDG